MSKLGPNLLAAIVRLRNNFEQGRDLLLQLEARLEEFEDTNNRIIRAGTEAAETERDRADFAERRSAKLASELEALRRRRARRKKGRK